VSLRAVASVTAATAPTPQWDPAGFAGRTGYRAALARAPGTEPHARYADVELGENPPPSGTRVHALPAAPAHARDDPSP
jgi:hypothetical protein